ncbi:non-ribosomal peptide synthetase [Marinomonas aquiplantarum]|uniref:Amino acid adenylation domain-containing protein n=1 Tax=Marinomonas aquiplantarum TaxID=491951 RepID=A0A366D354_9GAMM|nr:non-ribosomal peptide synthetase [Marinomonas aquiplantarum]RBO83864.1 amino acid adenylation domain-containing protein [Marinomonas aquiplantarum]
MERKTLPLTTTQEGIWLADQVSDDKHIYTISHCVELKGDIQSNLLEQAIRLALGEADTVLAYYDNGQQHLIDLTDSFQVESIDFTSMKNGRENAFAIMQEDTNLDLLLTNNRQTPLQKQIIFSIEEEGHIVWLWYQRYHHIMLDGFSFTALTKRVAEIYTSLDNNHPITGSPFTSVAQVIEEENAYKASQKYVSDQVFWQEYCANLPPTISLSNSTTTKDQSSPSLIKHSVTISTHHLATLDTLSKTIKSNRAELLMSLVAAYLYRMNGQSNQVIGIPFMRRLGSASVTSTAPMVNVLPMSIELDGNMTWGSVAKHFKQSLKLIRRHQNYSAEQIQRDLKKVNSSALYNTLINYKQFDYDLNFSGTAGTTHHLATGPVDDLEFSIIVEKDRTYFELRANSQKYNNETLKAHGCRLSTMLSNWLLDERLPLSQLAILPEVEYETIMAWGTGRSFEPNNLNNILDVFWQQVERKPDATALVCRAPSEGRETRYSFHELSNEINQLSRFLIKKLELNGATGNSVIACAMPRSAQSIIAMMSILNTGATFLPLDMDYPQERMEMMCEDTSPILLLSHSSVSVELDIPTLNLDDDAIIASLATYSNTKLTEFERSTPSGSDIAYVIFTSGSTGRPKGVMNTHNAMLNLLLSHQDSIYRPTQKVVQERYPNRALRAAHTHSFSFDSSWLQVFWLIQGEELYVFDEDTRRDAFAIVEEVHNIKIDAMDLPPSLLAQLLNNGLMDEANHSDHQPSLILIGGEACPSALWQQLRSFPKLISHNLYGPTEYTVDTLRANLAMHLNPVVGRPIANTQTYILDTQLQPVPIGMLGELYISGEGLAQGYLARAGLSASRFIADPFSHEVGCRMYRTGDIVRWNSEGFIEFVGRGDDQVKIRGYRVEIGEVENALSQLEAVESAIVIAEEINNSHRLIGYCAVPSLPEQKFKQYGHSLVALLKQHLPDYMVPAAICVMASLPRNVSGKIDKKALPNITIESASSTFVAPINEAEERLCLCFSIVLKIEKISTTDDFFALGGDSISAIMLCTELRKKGYALRPSQVFKLRSPQALAKEISSISKDMSLENIHQWELKQNQWDILSTQYHPMADVAPLLPLQKGMLFETIMDSATGNYNAYTRLNFTGEMNLSQLQNALNTLLVHYPQLAGAFDSESLEEPVLVIPNTKNEIWQWPLSTHSIRMYDDSQKLAALEELEQTLLETPHPVDTFTGMIHAAYVDIGQDKTSGLQQSALILIVHHLVIDGWSTPLLIRDLLNAYQQRPLKPIASSYTNVIKQLYSRDQQASINKWQEVMHQVQACQLFEQHHEQVSEYSFKLAQDLSRQFTSQLKEQGITLNVFMQVLWAQMLNLLSGKEDIVFGSPVSGRSSHINGIEDQVGLFLNTLPIRVTLDPKQSLWDQLPALQERHISLLEHDAIGLTDIQKLAGTPNLFDTLLVVENYPDNDYLDITLKGEDGKSLTISDIQNRGYSHYPLALLIIPGEEITFLIENRGAMTIGEVKALSQRIEQTIKTSLNSPERLLCQYQSASLQEIDFINAINNTEQSVEDLTLQSALSKQAQLTPNALCVSDMQYQLNYQEARQQVQTLAHSLRIQGVSSGDIVAVAIPRSCHLSLAIWAIIEVGAAYLPLDLSYPDDRLDYMLEDAKPVLLITQSTQQSRFSEIHKGVKQLPFDHFYDHTFIENAAQTIHNPNITGNHPAYLIYTSGTTGRPKGVLVSHKAIINRILWMQHEYQLTPEDVVLQKTPSSFDVSVWEFFWAPMVGASLVMADPDAHRDPELLMQTIDQFNVTTLHFVPSMLAIFTATLQSKVNHHSTCTSLKQVFCSGEALLKAQAQAFKNCSNAQLHNLYGPTEAAVDVTYKPAFDDLSSKGQGIAIGKPVWNTELRILDQYLRPVPVGVTGELYLCGTQLAMGYLDRPELNCVRFIADPYGMPGDRMYRTGDLVRWLENGDVEYLGRADNQIKIRGQRIELGEIEAALLEQNGVEQAVVVAQTLNIQVEQTTGQDNRQLVAYLTLEPSKLEVYDEPTIKFELSKVLPNHMLPIAYVVLESLPLSANGKLDRNALPKPNLAKNDQPNNTSRSPAIGLESQLARLFSNILGIEQIKADDDFFALGGHSLLAMRLAADIRKEVKQPITVGQIMVTSTIAKLAQLLQNQTEQDSREKLASMLTNDQLKGKGTNSGFDDLIYLREGQGAPLFCFYPGSGFAWQYSVLSRYLKGKHPIIGLQSPRPNGLIASSDSLEELVVKQLKVILREQANGPYYLLGYSLGGTVAYGVAAKLREMGKTVSFLGLLDTYPAEVHDWNDPQGEEAAMGAEREQTQLLTDAISDKNNDSDDVALLVKQEQDKMLEQIFANYKDAVRLLKKASTPLYDEKMHVFIAQQSLPDYISPTEQWPPYANRAHFHSLDHCSHENILSPDNLKTLGPLLDRLIHEASQELITQKPSNLSSELA